MYAQYKPAFNLTDFLLKSAALTILFIISLGAYLIINALIGYELISAAIVIYFIYRLLRMAGLLIMYPGSFTYYRGVIESSYSMIWKRRIQSIIKILLKNSNRDQTHREDVSAGLQFLIFFRNTLQKYEKKPSGNKQNLIDLVNQIIQSQIGLEQLIKSGTASDDQIDQISKWIKHKLEKLEESLKRYTKPSGLLSQIKYFMSEEKLYNINYGFGLYDVNYHYERKKVGKIDLIVFNGFKSRTKIPTAELVLFCHPNGAYLEQFAVDCKITNFYLQQGLNVCLWNYRGYSESEGEPCIVNHQQDVLKIYDSLREWGYNPIISHGYSIGGPVAIYLAKQRSINLLVAERTFSSLSEMSREYGIIISIFNYIVFWRDQSDFSKMFYDLKCNKVVINDPQDQVIENSASIKTGLSKTLVQTIRASQSSSVKNKNHKDNDKEGIELQSQSFQLDQTGINIQIPLVRHLVTQETKATNLLNTQFIKSLISNTMPFASDQQKYYDDSINLTKSFEEISWIFKKDVSAISEFIPKDINSIEAATQSAKKSFSRVIFPNSCFSPLTTLENKKLQNSTQTSLMKSVENYVNGLIAYGTFYGDQRDSISPEINRIKTIHDLYCLYQEIEICEKQNQDNFEMRSLFVNMRLQVSCIGCVIIQNMSHPAYAQIGILIPSCAGHNGELKNQQFFMLSEIVKHTLTQLKILN